MSSSVLQLVLKVLDVACCCCVYRAYRRCWDEGNRCCYACRVCVDACTEDDDGEDQEIRRGFARKFIPLKYLAAELAEDNRMAMVQRQIWMYAALFIAFLFYANAQNDFSRAYRLNDAVRKHFIETDFHVNVANYTPGSAAGRNKVFFDGITSERDFWAWVDQLVYEPLLSENALGINQRPHDVNQLLWGVRFRQKRVGAGFMVRCVRTYGEVYDHASCAGKYAASEQETTPYGPMVSKVATGLDGARREYTEPVYAWYSRGAAGGGDWNAGRRNYDPSGFIVDLDVGDSARAREQLREMSVHYVDRRTRAIFVTLNFYNLDTNMFCTTQFLCEFTEFGNLIMTYQIWSHELIRDVEMDAGYGFEIFFNIMFLSFIVLQVRSIINAVSAFVHDTTTQYITWWIAIDIILAGLFAYHIWHMVNREIWGEPANTLLVHLKQRYLYLELTPWQMARDWMQMVYGMTALVFALRFIRLFADINARFNIMLRAITECAFAGWFSLYTIVVLIGFTIGGTAIFGADVPSFRNVQNTAREMLPMLVGAIKFEDMFTANVTAPVFIFLFFFVVIWLLYNLLIGILLESWVKAAKLLAPDDFSDPLDILNDERRCPPLIVQAIRCSRMAKVLPRAARNCLRLGYECRCNTLRLTLTGDWKRCFKRGRTTDIGCSFQVLHPDDVTTVTPSQLLSLVEKMMKTTSFALRPYADIHSLGQSLHAEWNKLREAEEAARGTQHTKGKNEKKWSKHDEAEERFKEAKKATANGVGGTEGSGEDGDQAGGDTAAREEEEGREREEESRSGSVSGGGGGEDNDSGSLEEEGSDAEVKTMRTPSGPDWQRIAYDCFVRAKEADVLLDELIVRLQSEQRSTHAEMHMIKELADSVVDLNNVMIEEYADIKEMHRVVHQMQNLARKKSKRLAEEMHLLDVRY